MIPVEIDAPQLIADLREWGWLDSKIEVRCGFSQGYVAQIRCGNVSKLAYQRAARLINFWESERELHIPLQNRTMLVTST